VSRLRRRAALLAAAALALAACTKVGPDYRPPPLDVPAAFLAPPPPAAQAAARPAALAPAPPGLRWWDGFGDPLLAQLVDLGIARNLDVLTAASRVREARAVARGAAAARLPTLDASLAAAGDLRASSGGSGSSRDGSGSVSGGGRSDRSSAAVDGLLGFGWDLDLAGGIARTVEAAEAEAARQEALGREARLGVAAGIATAYVGLRGAQRRLELAEEALALQRQSLDLVRRRVEAGLAPGLDLLRAQAAVAALAAEPAPIRAEIDRQVNALSVLTAEPPGRLAGQLRAQAPIPALAAAPPLGLPVDLVRRRPGLQAAELALVRATAEIGVATAALYPRLTLPGSLGIGLSDIGTGDIVRAAVASVSAVLDVPLFDGGARRADLAAARERAQQALHAYRLALLQALEEVEAALLSHAAQRERREALAAAVAANEQAYAQAQDLYTQGLASFLDVLDAQRELTATRRSLAEAEAELSVQAVALYRALGMGVETAAATTG